MFLRLRKEKIRKNFSCLRILKCTLNKCRRIDCTFELSGMNRVVVVNSYETIKEALMSRGHDFAGRPTDSIPNKIQSNNFQSLASSDYSKSWSFLRKLTYKSLHIYGTGMKAIESLVVEEIDAMISSLSKEVGKPILIHQYFGNFF